MWHVLLAAVVRHKMLLLMVGGALGTAARYWISKWVSAHPWGQVFPVGTFLINVSGSFILGLAAVTPPVVHGQFLQGTIDGNITDTSQAALVGAKIVAIDQATGLVRETVTSQSW